MYWIRTVAAFLAIGVFLLSASASLHLSSARLTSDSPFKLPVPPGVYVEVTQGNNMPSPDWDHNGLSAYAFDFALLTGTYNFVVTAAQGGKVIGVDDSSTTRCDGIDHEAGAPKKVKSPGCWTHANYVLIADKDGTTAALYMHLLTHSAKVRVGYDVKQGQQLGLADTTGFALGNPHLHFQVEEMPSKDAQKNQPAGWWFTQSVPVSFSNPEAVKQHKDGVPLTYDKFCLGDKTCSSTPPPTILPGGMWTDPSPKEGQTVSDVIHLAAHAYPTHAGDPAIAQVNFTVGSQGPWRVACTAVPPATGDVFACDANLKNLGVPYGQIQISFDVYDQAGNVNLAPKGVHTLNYAPPPKLEVNPTSIDNLTLGNSDCTSTPVSSTCLIVLSSPSSNQLNINWSATLAGPRSSLGSVKVTPSSGTLAPGQSADVYLYVPDICGGPTTAPETITFTGGANPVVVKWTC